MHPGEQRDQPEGRYGYSQRHHENDQAVGLFGQMPLPEQHGTQEAGLEDEGREYPRSQQWTVNVAYLAHELGPKNAKLYQSGRSEERRGGKECVSTFRSRWSPDV